MGVVKSVFTARTWRKEGRGPKFLRCGRLVKYRLSDVESFIDGLPHGGGRNHVERSNKPRLRGDR
jgi:hypothetical protein